MSFQLSFVYARCSATSFMTWNFLWVVGFFICCLNIYNFSFLLPTSILVHSSQLMGVLRNIKNYITFCLKALSFDLARFSSNAFNAASIVNQWMKKAHSACTSSKLSSFIPLWSFSLMCGREINEIIVGKLKDYALTNCVSGKIYCNLI